jgi:hypothetical protein
VATLVPPVPGMDKFKGTIRHSMEYKRPDGDIGKKVIVIFACIHFGQRTMFAQIMRAMTSVHPYRLRLSSNSLRLLTDVTMYQ